MTHYNQTNPSPFDEIKSLSPAEYLAAISRTPPKPPLAVKSPADLKLGSLKQIYARADFIRQCHRLPTPFILIHALSAAAAMARDSVSSRLYGRVDLPLLVQSPEVYVPDWIFKEWHAMEQNDDLCNQPQILEHPMRIKAQRRRNRVRSLLDPESFFASPFIERIIKIRMRFSRVAVTYGTRKLARPSESRSLTHLCGSLPRVRAVLRRMHPDSSVESLIGCLTPEEFKQLVRSHGPSFITQLGLVLPAPEAAPIPEGSPGPRPMVEALFHGIIRRCQNKPPFVFNLDPSTEAQVVEYMRERNEWVMNLPEVCRPLMPDHKRVVHMAALLACICDPQEPDTIAASTYMAMQLDEWAFKHHLHLIRHHYPADDRGWFEGKDLNVHRQLSSTPQTLRDIQRRLRETRKAECLSALQRAVTAGVAIEQQGPVYRLPFRPTYDLSEKQDQITGYFY